MPDKATKRHARTTLNNAVRLGKLPRPAALPCVDCGHLGPDRMHHYDHYLGYAPEHVLSVEPVCAPCHGKRKIARDEGHRKTHCDHGHALVRGTDGHWRCRECRLAYWRERSKRLHLGCTLN